jgi:hypothetical protein
MRLNLLIVCMRLIDVFYYQYFSFYKKLLKDPDPYFTTLLSLSMSESLLVNGSLDIIALKYFCYQIDVSIQFGLLLVIIYCNYLFFYRTNKLKQILKSKPTIGNNHTLSTIVTLLFFLLTVSWLFWGPIYGKYLFDKCK